MYTPPAFKEEELSVLHAIIEAASLSTFVTATADGLLATPLPLLLDRDEGPHGTLYGHLARANPQGTTAPIGAAMATFLGRTPMSRPPGTRPSANTERLCRPGTIRPCMPMARSSSSPTRTGFSMSSPA